MKPSKSEQKEIRKQYMKTVNKNRVIIRMSPEEKTLLQEEMRQNGWDNLSGFIKYKLFGLDPDQRIDSLIKSGDPESIALLLRNRLMDLTGQYIYIRYRYDRDMNQLYREEGVNLKEWTKATEKWLSALVSATNESFALLRKVAVKLGLNDFFVSESDAMDINLDTATKEQLDALAAQIHKENTALGRPDTFD